jgi:hypothetical protein
LLLLHLPHVLYLAFLFYNCYFHLTPYIPLSSHLEIFWYIPSPSYAFYSFSPISFSRFLIYPYFLFSLLHLFTHTGSLWRRQSQ